MNIALCYENVLPARGGCETYIADLSRRLVNDGHEVHLYACRWVADALPKKMHCHALPRPAGPRFLRPWRFSAACRAALQANLHHVSIGFDKTWGQDVLYPQGGLHAASADHNIHKHRQGAARVAARIIKKLDLAHWSFMRLEKKQYFSAKPDETRPLIVVNSHMVARHFEQYYHVDQEFLAKRLRVIHSAIDPSRFGHADRPKRRQEFRQQWKIGSEETVGVFVAMNYRLKGLEPLLRAVSCLPKGYPFRFLIAGHPRFESYARLGEKLGIAKRVIFLGPRRDVHDCYYAADFLLHPTFYDPCSLVVLEAIACGLPVITSRFNGASEFIVGKAGFVVDDPHDHAKLAWLITQFFDSFRRAACAQAARETAATWTFEHHYQRLMEVLTEAAVAKRAA